MMNTVLCPTQEDKERLNGLLKEIGDIIARSNTKGLELDFDFWATTHFSEATGYGQEEPSENVPSLFRDFIEDLNFGE